MRVCNLTGAFVKLSVMCFKMLKTVATSGIGTVSCILVHIISFYSLKKLISSSFIVLCRSVKSLIALKWAPLSVTVQCWPKLRIRVCVSAVSDTSDKYPSILTTLDSSSYQSKFCEPVIYYSVLAVCLIVLRRYI